MKEFILAKRYARALFQMALEEKSLERFLEEVSRFQKALASDPFLPRLLVSRQVDRRKRLVILNKIMESLYLSPSIRSFFLLLFEKSRLELTAPVSRALEAMAAEYNNEETALVEVADKNLFLGMESKVLRCLEKLTGKKVVARIRENRAIIGGMKIRLGDKIFDASIQGELARMKEALA